MKRNRLNEDEGNATGTGKNWDSGVVRGKANPISNTGTWESGASRGKANPISNTDSWDSGIVRGKANPVTTNEDGGVDRYRGKTLMSVDIQPEYSDGLPFNLHNWAEMLNEHKGEIVFLFNGHDTLGMVTLANYQDWLMDYGVTEDVINNSTFYDKGYAFFRYCIDEGIKDEETVNLVKFMIEKDVNDSRDLDEEFWNQFMERYGNHSIKDLMQFAHDGIYLPELMDFLQHFNNIVVCGGGANECLKEVEIALQALNKPYETYHEYVYEENQKLNEQLKRCKTLIRLLS